MNILPLILALVMMLSVLTIERLGKFKNQSIVHREYQVFLKESERVVFNDRERRLFSSSYQKSLRQLTFRYLYDKKARERNPNEAKQYRMLISELMKIVYGQAFFFKELETKRPHFLEEMLTAIEKAADEAPKNLIRRTKDLARLNLDDLELQNAFYHMLKGTITRDQLEELTNLSPRRKGKAYVSLFTYINIDGANKPPQISIARSPRETLKAIFMTDEIVDAVIERRTKLGGKDKDSGNEAAFKNEFILKVRPGIEEKLLNFELSKNSSDYD